MAALRRLAAAEQVQALAIRRDDEFGITQVHAGFADGGILDPRLATGGNQRADCAFALVGSRCLAKAQVEQVLEACEIGEAVVRGLVPDFFDGNEFRDLRMQRGGGENGKEGEAADHKAQSYRIAAEFHRFFGRVAKNSAMPRQATRKVPNVSTVSTRSRRSLPGMKPSL